jgi:beta-glucanase (GH16 family)
MPERVLALALFGLLAAGCNSPPPGIPEDSWAGPSGTLREVLRDDFDGPAGSAPNPSYFHVLDKEMNWNQEMQYYTQDRKNSYLDGAGNLVLEAYQENYLKPDGTLSAQPYTSARLETAGLIEQRYGRFEARIWLPKGKGIWPAFWLLSNNYQEVGWPDCGEVDILELAGSKDNQVNGTMHGPGYSGSFGLSRTYVLEGGSFADGFHVFAIEWAPDGMRWLIDGQSFHERTPAGMGRSDLQWVFDRPMYMLLNLAVGGIYDGPPDETTVFPARMVIDYVSVSALE